MKKLNITTYLILLLLILSIIALNIYVRICLFVLSMFLLFINKNNILEYLFQKYQNNNFKDLKSELNNLNKEKEKIENNLTNLSKINDNLSLENKQEEKIKMSIDKYRNDLTILKTDYEEKINQYSSELNTLNIKTKELEKSITISTKQKENLSNDVSSLTTKKALLIEEINNLIDNKLDLENQIELLKPCVPLLSKLTMEQIDNMDPYKFEYLTKLLLEKLNYENVIVTNDSKDYGIDVIAEQDGIKYGFQCKLYSGNVGVSAIQQTYAGIQHYDCNIGIVITNSLFTKQAQKQADETNIILWDRNKLIDKLSETDYSFNINYK